MCGGDIIANEEKTFGACDYCGSTMTLPKVSDDQRAARFNRGNHFRRQGDFDKALAVYETIVNEDETDAEAHWCCALCRFGIEYVEDPNTYEYLPTCHRASFDSFLEDADYLAALEYSDGITKRQYQKDAAKIATVQRGILATSQNEEPYDIFICYKETEDNTKERTRDSLDAQDIYYQLTQEGYRVFFSRITLEDKVGAEYEPYIFAALNSAKVMIAIGSKPEFFNAVWVKNEWSRFLSMMRKDRSKLLLPCYKDMDPYDLPEQLGVLQSYDMTKIGFVQDLIRGVKKVLGKDEPKGHMQTVTANVGATDITPLLKRMFMYLEDGEWDKADEYSEKVLDKDPENAAAFIGKLMVDLKVSHMDDLKNRSKPFENNKHYQKAIRFADDSLKNELNGYIDFINKRNEEEKRKKEESLRDENKEINAYLQDMDEYNKKSKIVYDKRSAYIEERISERVEEIREEAKNAMDRRISTLNQMIAEIKSRKDEAENKLVRLGSFKFQEKKNIKSVIEECMTDISIAETELTHVENEYSEKIRNAKSEAKKMANTWIFEAQDKYPLPLEPRKPASYLKKEQKEKIARERQEKMSDLTDSERKRQIQWYAIEDHLRESGPMTAEEMLDNIPELSDASIQLVNALNRGLIVKHIIIRFTENGKTYYRVID
jgi:tetratricopeptide (TPR) repeat protein